MHNIWEYLELAGYSIVAVVLISFIWANVKAERHHPTFGPDRDKRK